MLPVKPTQWLRDWLDERCRLADGCIDLRADEVARWFDLRNELTPDMDKADAVALLASPSMPEWLELYVDQLRLQLHDPALSDIQKTLAWTTINNINVAFLSATVKHNATALEKMAEVNNKLLALSRR